MAEKRMLSKSFLFDSKFMTMPDSAQVLYVYLNVNADDDGIIDSYSIIKMLGSKEDDLKILQAKGYIVPIDDYLVFLPDWLQNQSLRIDRYRPSMHRFRLLNLYPNYFNNLKPIKLSKILESKQTENLREELMNKWYAEEQPLVYQTDPQLRLGQIRSDSDKIRLDKVSIDKVRSVDVGILDNEGLLILNRDGNRYTESQRLNFLQILSDTKTETEKEFAIEINPENYHKTTNQMLCRIFYNLNQKINLGAEVNDIAYFKKSVKNHWSEIAENVQKNRNELLNSLRGYK
ncbi:MULTISPECIES: hypothetical protein [Enterococcus]|jgi:hypothetical protein|uniref:hypothetical protein n=1 Tax=Enterococcus TaxID=1350 RepID=UPI000CF17681|nr:MULTISPECIES: hypothetical protein [Enterococcus]EGO2676919.1 hypothetical protein [Enterococcus faecalis]EGO2718943.1 hypothetical protein [Enterococcus faecalis]EGO2848506.1 hypothetical protein [Enterococcus faecalis]EGO5240567.1 hypothetical protein [Enterococcus faecalis]EGO7802729.1 hypothetical protein [Enterococcus faecalis]